VTRTGGGLPAGLGSDRRFGERGLGKGEAHFVTGVHDWYTRVRRLLPELNKMAAAAPGVKPETRRPRSVNAGPHTPRPKPRGCRFEDRADQVRKLETPLARGAVGPCWFLGMPAASRSTGCSARAWRRTLLVPCLIGQTKAAAEFFPTPPTATFGPHPCRPLFRAERRVGEMMAEQDHRVAAKPSDRITLGHPLICDQRL
jgi:hypothetical protein